MLFVKKAFVFRVFFGKVLIKTGGKWGRKTRGGEEEKEKQTDGWVDG